MKRKWYCHSAIGYTVIICYLGSLYAPYFASRANAAAQPVNVESAYERAREDLAIFFRQLKTVQTAIDQTKFNPETLAKQLGPKIDDLFTFVRDQVAYQPYRGALRFAEGTLMSRAGNAYDKSLLLGALLRAHGYEVRYAQGQLTADQARQLIAHTDQPPPINTHPRLRDRLDHLCSNLLGERIEMTKEHVDAVHSAVSARLESFQVALAEYAQFDYGLLTQQLGTAGILFGNATQQIDEVLIEQAREHCWVQVRSKESWLDLDSSLPTLKMGHRLTKSIAESEGLPDAKAYKLQITLFINQEHDGKQTTKTVLDHTALLNQAVNHLSIMTMPEPFASTRASTGFSDPKAFERFEVVIPALRVNGRTIAGQPFNLEGEVVASDPRVAQATKLQKPLKTGFEAISSARCRSAKLTGFRSAKLSR